jgi:glycosyltransferase involved in cell wall biosynthesis
MTRVSIVTCFYNRERIVARTLRSMLAQTHEDLEAIVVDDGSTDGTLGEMHKFSDPRLRIVTHKNMGFTASMVEAIASSSGSYIAVLGSGDEAFPDRMATQALYLDRHPDVCVLGTRYNQVALDGTIEVSPDYHDEPDPYGLLLKKSIYGHSEVMFRRSVYDEVGGYRPFFKYSQDNDLWLRMGERGKLAQIPQVLQSTFKQPDGVTVNPSTLLLSKVYRDFAVFCANERLAGRPDPLEKFGPSAAFLRPRSKQLGRRLASDARRLILEGRADDAQPFIRAASGEGLVLAPAVLTLMARSPGVAALYAKWRDLRTSRRDRISKTSASQTGYQPNR